MTELKPCPFCGGTNLKIKGGIGKYVSCLDCDNGAHFPGEGSTANENDAIEAWNTRTEREVGISKFQKITGTSYLKAKHILGALEQAGAKVVE